MKVLALSFVALCVAVGAASAQSVQQSGTVTPGHVSTWVTSGVVKDSGPATQGNISELGITKNGGLPFCITTGPTSSAAYDQICIGVQLNGQAFISVTPYGTAMSIPLNFIIDGVTYSIGGTNWLSGLLDQQFGSAPGDVLCRSTAAWFALAPGSVGQVLETQGSIGCPAWASSTVVTTPASRRITSGSTDTATSTDNFVNWASATTSAKTETIYACNGGAQGKTLIISDEEQTSSTYPITISPASGTIFDHASFVLNSSGAALALQCDGNSNWVPW